MSAAQQLDSLVQSPLAAERLQRKLAVEETARRPGILPERVEWLEAGRVYRFPTPDAALLAVVLYAPSLGIERDEARALAGLPIEARPERHSRHRIASEIG